MKSDNFCSDDNGASTPRAAGRPPPQAQRTHAALRWVCCVLLSVLVQLGAPAASAQGPARPAPAASGDGLARMRADQAWLVDQIGPRPGGSAAEQAGADGVAARLRAAGWDPQPIIRPSNLIACRGAPRRVFLAHIDSVPGSPGAVDNAAAVAVLLELARDPAPQDLCLAFPDREELGLEGSAAMAAHGPWGAAPPELAVALDLVGHGELRVMGLGRRWSDSGLAWLHAATAGGAGVPFVHRLYSRALPHMERSDHAPFADRGSPALLVFGVGEGEIFDRYHQPTDDLLRGQPGDGAALIDALRFVQGLARAPPMPPPVPGGEALHIGGLLLPSAWAWVCFGLAVALCLVDLRRPPPLLRLLWVPPLAVGLGAVGAALSVAAFDLMLPWGAARGLRPPAVTAEQTADAVMGLPTRGWWAGALLTPVIAVLLLIGARYATRRLLPDPRLSPWAATLSAGAALALDPMLAGVFAAAALAARVHPALAAAPAALLLRPDALRQLAFHGLIEPAGWGALCGLLALGLAARAHRGAAQAPPPPSDAGREHRG
ncbi:MAG: M28 family peptidase [Deltaproteobacteria bacterium]|nr:M28 family peptidase [Deltaproteobacteria bacterium]